MESEYPTPQFEVVLVSTAEERQSVFAVRMIVFVEEQQVPPEEELDHYDMLATHILARRSDLPSENAEESIVGTARLLDKGQGIGKVGRVAVLKEYRGLGVGALLMRGIEAIAREQGYTRLVLDAQTYAIPFYEKLGYHAEGEIFLDCNIEHRFMSKSIA